jgi:hypothetical protein
LPTGGQVVGSTGRISQSGTLTSSGVISGAGGVTQSGTGTTTLTLHLEEGPKNPW